MPYDATIFNLMIASPSDVASERTIISKVVAEWNAIHSERRGIVVLPVAWETHVAPEMGDRPQALINKRLLTHCDLLVGVFWTRIGTATGEYISGTVEEIEEHMGAGKPTMLYFSSAPVHPDSVDPEQYKALKAFKATCQSRGICETYADLNDFEMKFYRHMQLKLNQDEYFTAVSPASSSEVSALSSLGDIPTLSREAQALLKEASRDPRGVIGHLLHSGGLIIETNEKNFVPDNDPRARAVWESALEELEREALVVDKGYKREVFGLTRRGYDVAEIINP